MHQLIGPAWSVGIGQRGQFRRLKQLGLDPGRVDHVGPAQLVGDLYHRFSPAVLRLVAGDRDQFAELADGSMGQRIQPGPIRDGSELRRQGIHHLPLHDGARFADDRVLRDSDLW